MVGETERKKETWQVSPSPGITAFTEKKGCVSVLKRPRTEALPLDV